MKYLLDSNTVSDFYEAETNETIISHLQSLPADDVVYISILTLYEFEFRFANAPAEMKQRIRTQLITMRDDFETLPLSESGASIFGELKKALYAMRGMKPENLKKHNIDLMLAGNAIAIQAIMVSADSLYADLQKLDSRLRCEDWTVI